MPRLRRFPARDQPRRPPDQERGPAVAVRGARVRPGRDLPRQRQRGLRSRRRRLRVVDRSNRGRAGRVARLRGARLSTRGRRGAGDRGATRRSIPARSRRRPASSRSRCCHAAPSAKARREVLAMAADEDRLDLRGRELYWLPSGGMLDSALDLDAIDALLGLSTRADKGHDRPDRREALQRPGSVRARQRGELDLAADRADLLWQLGELDVGDELHLVAERPEEVVVVGGDDDARVEAGEDALPVVAGEAAAGDPGEEDVDAALADRVVDRGWRCPGGRSAARRPRSRCPRPGRSGRRRARGSRGARR